MQSSDINKASQELILKIYRWRKHLIIVTGLAAIISAVVSFLMAPQYKSTAIIFPSRSFSVSKLLIEQNVGNQEDYMEIGDEDDAEKLLQILNSEAVRLRVADKYDLWTNWKIDKKGTYANHYMKLKWDDMVSFKRTDYVSVRIDVYDYVANRAADIANAIVEYADSVKNDMSHVVAVDAFKIIEEEYNSTLKHMNELEDSLQSLRKMGVLDYKEQVEAYTKSYAKAIEKGNESGAQRLAAKLKILEEHGGAYQHIYENLKKYRFKYPVIKAKYDEAQVNLTKVLPYKFVVDKATPNEKKAKPVRWLMVAFSTIGAFFFTLVLLLGIDRFRALKKMVASQEQNQG